MEWLVRFLMFLYTFVRMRGNDLVHKSFLSLFFFTLFFKFGAGIHYTVLSAFGERVFPVWLVGVIISVASVIQMALDVPAGLLLDRFGYKKLLTLFTGVFIIAGAALFFGLSPVTFIATTLLSTFGWLFYNPGVNAYILSEAPRATTGKTMGRMHAFDSAGIVAATAVLPFVIAAPAQVVGAAVSALLLVSFVFLYFVPRETLSVHHVEKTPRHHYYIRREFLHNVVVAMKKLNPASALLALQSFSAAAFYGMIWFAVPIAIAQGLAGDLPSVGLGVFDLAVVLLGALFGKLADTFHRPLLVTVGLFSFAVAGFLLGFNLNLFFLLLGFLATAGDELSNVSLWAWMDSLDANHAQNGLINGVITLFEDLGWAVGPLVAGLLYNVVGPGWVIAIGAGVLFLTFLVSLFVLYHPRVRPLHAFRGFSHAPHRRRHKR